jgi:iron complex outermembrane receptor protein
VSATLGGRYEFALTPGVDASVAAHVKYRGDYYLDPEGLETRMQAGFSTLQAEAAFQFVGTGLGLTVWGRNLTDEDYALSGYGFIGYNTFRSDPRTFGLRLDYSF